MAEQQIDKKPAEADKKAALVTEITPRTSRAGTWTSSVALSWPTIRRSRAAW
jgi:hypothetical protein